MELHPAIAQLANDWRQCGIEPGDTLVLHSSLKRTLERMRPIKRDISPDDILDSFLEALGTKGTLLLPTFNSDFCKGAPFDIRTTPSLMGALGEAGRNRRESVRTGHPIYSFAVIGARSGDFANLENHSAWGPDSPFALVTEMAGKIAVLDVPDRHSMTYYHYVEEVEEVPFRYHKEFTGSYTDESGTVCIKSFSLFVRDIEAGIIPCLDEMGEVLWSEGLYEGFRPGVGPGLRSVPTRAAFSVTQRVIREGRAEGTLYFRDLQTSESHKRVWQDRVHHIRQDQIC